MTEEENSGVKDLKKAVQRHFYEGRAFHDLPPIIFDESIVGWEKIGLTVLNRYKQPFINQLKQKVKDDQRKKNEKALQKPAPRIYIPRMQRKFSHYPSATLVSDLERRHMTGKTIYVKAANFDPELAPQRKFSVFEELKKSRDPSYRERRSHTTYARIGPSTRLNSVEGENENSRGETLPRQFPRRRKLFRSKSEIVQKQDMLDMYDLPNFFMDFDLDLRRFVRRKSCVCKSCVGEDHVKFTTKYNEIFNPFSEQEMRNYVKNLFIRELKRIQLDVPDITKLHTQRSDDTKSTPPGEDKSTVRTKKRLKQAKQAKKLTFLGQIGLYAIKHRHNQRPLEEMSLETLSQLYRAVEKKTTNENGMKTLENLGQQFLDANGNLTPYATTTNTKGDGDFQDNSFETSSNEPIYSHTNTQCNTESTVESSKSAVDRKTPVGEVQSLWATLDMRRDSKVATGAMSGRHRFSRLSVSGVPEKSRNDGAGNGANKGSVGRSGVTSGVSKRYSRPVGGISKGVRGGVGKSSRHVPSLVSISPTKKTLRGEKTVTDLRPTASTGDCENFSERTLYDKGNLHSPGRKKGAKVSGLHSIQSGSSTSKSKTSGPRNMVKSQSQLILSRFDRQSNGFQDIKPVRRIDPEMLANTSLSPSRSSHYKKGNKFPKLSDFQTIEDSKKRHSIVYFNESLSVRKGLQHADLLITASASSVGGSKNLRRRPKPKLSGAGDLYEHKGRKNRLFPLTDTHKRISTGSHFQF